MQQKDELSYRFCEVEAQHLLIVELPSTVSSLRDVELDIGLEEVRLQLLDGRQQLQIPLQKELVGSACAAAAKFSKRRGQLTISWPRSEASAVASPCPSPTVVGIDDATGSSSQDVYSTEASSQDVGEAGLQKVSAATPGTSNDSSSTEKGAAQGSAAGSCPSSCAVDTVAPSGGVPSGAGDGGCTASTGSSSCSDRIGAVSPASCSASPGKTGGSTPAYGSLWNANSWHWEEKNCLEVAREQIRVALTKVASPRLRHVPELSGAGVLLSNVIVNGEAGINLRRGKRILFYELEVSFCWEGVDEFGGKLGVKGKGAVKELTQETEETPKVTVEVSRHSATCTEGKAVGGWLRKAGGSIIVDALRAETLSQAIMEAEVAAADADADRKRRQVEKQRAAMALQATGAEQARIAAEQKEREAVQRCEQLAKKPSDSQAAQGSVWNANSWHWEERPMTSWSHDWISRELGNLKVRLLGGAAEAVAESAPKVSGDVSVSVRKGKLIVLFQLQLEFHWAVSMVSGAEQFLKAETARGSLCMPDFNSEEGVESSAVDVEVQRDGSAGRRLSGAFRREGVRAVRGVLAGFSTALAAHCRSAEHGAA